MIRSTKIFLGAIVLTGLLTPFLISSSPALAHPPLQSPFPKFNLKDPCARDRNNLIVNGTMREERGFQLGSIAEGWDAFIISGAPPNFRRADNEGIDGADSQQIYSDKTFDAGIYQTVRQLQPGAWYLFRLGYALAAKYYGGPNVRVDSIGRQIGVDPTGGADVTSANVIWGAELFNGNAALNLPEMQMLFAARADRATIFLRAKARDGAGGENRVWFDAVCMEARPEIPPATLTPPTATPIPSATTRAPTARATATRTITRLPTATPTQVILLALKAPATESDSEIEDDDAARANNSRVDAGLLLGVGTTALIGAGLFFALGFWMWKIL